MAIFSRIWGRLNLASKEWRITYIPKISSPNKYKDAKLRLRAELIPRPNHFQSLKRLLSTKEWNAVRLAAFQTTHNKCEVCESSERLSCHEVWAFDDKLHVQKLLRLKPLCGMCHFVEHLGLAEILANKGNLDFNAVIRHFCNVNKCDVGHFIVHRERAMAQWRVRSKAKWKIDFGDFDPLLSNTLRVSFETVAREPMRSTAKRNLIQIGNPQSVSETINTKHASKSKKKKS